MKRALIIAYCCVFLCYIGGSYALVANNRQNPLEPAREPEFLQIQVEAEAATSEEDCEPDCLFKFPYLEGKDCGVEPTDGGGGNIVDNGGETHNPEIEGGEEGETWQLEAEKCYDFTGGNGGGDIEINFGEEGETWQLEAEKCYDFGGEGGHEEEGHGEEGHHEKCESICVYQYPFNGAGNCKLAGGQENQHNDEEEH